MDLNYITAKEKMLTASQVDCQHFFAENGCILELAYWNLLHQRPEEAEALFKEIEAQDTRAQWGVFIAGLVQGKINGYPTYFQLRNFLEIDLNLFLQYYLGEYVEQVIKYTDWLYTINAETPKFIGRVFLKNGYDDYGLLFLNKGKDYLYQDPELHYLLAEYYAEIGDLQKTKESLNNCLCVLPHYYPAIALQRKLKLNCQD